MVRPAAEVPRRRAGRRQDPRCKVNPRGDAPHAQQRGERPDPGRHLVHQPTLALRVPPHVRRALRHPARLLRPAPHVPRDGPAQRAVALPGDQGPPLPQGTHPDPQPVCPRERLGKCHPTNHPGHVPCRGIPTRGRTQA